MLDYKTDLFILGDKNYKDFDRIIVAYTKNLGKKYLRIRGAYKPLSKLNPNLHFFSIVDCDVINGKSFDYVCNANEEIFYSGISDSLKKRSIYFFVMEVIEKITYENIQDEGVYALCLRYFEFLDKFKIEEDALYVYFEKDLELIESLWKFLILFFGNMGFNIKKEYLDQKIIKDKKIFFNFVYFYVEKYLKTEKFFK